MKTQQQVVKSIAQVRAVALHYLKEGKSPSETITILKSLNYKVSLGGEVLSIKAVSVSFYMLGYIEGKAAALADKPKPKRKPRAKKTA